MEIVTYKEEEHYDMCKEWWEAHDWQAPPKDMLTEGILALHKDKKTFLAAGFL